MKKVLSLLTLLCLVTSAFSLEIDKDKFYTISNRNDNNLFVKDSGNDVLSMSSGVGNSAYWRFIPSGNPNCYYVQNLETGRYVQACDSKSEVSVMLGTEPVEYSVLLCEVEGEDCYGFTSTNLSVIDFTDGCIGWNWKNDNTVQTFAAVAGANHRSFWKLAEVNVPSCLLGAHDYQGGVCSVCGIMDTEYLTPDADGFYPLSTSADVEWFSAMVAAGNLTINAKMMNDIDFGGVENLHNPIGPSTAQKFNGTFDGQGYRIMNLIINRPDAENQGFFGFLRGNNAPTVVKNLIIDKSCSFTAKNKVGAVTGSCQNNGTSITLENIVNEANVTAVGGTDAGALIGGQEGNSPLWTIRNCVNLGTITAATNADGNGYAGAIAGWMGNNSSNLIENFINLGTIVNFNGTNNIGRLSGTVKGLVDLSGTENIGQGIVDELTVEDVANGKLTYYMNGNQEVINFYQTLRTDLYPMPFATSQQVYFNGQLSCSGEPLGEGSYTNDASAGTLPVHNYADGDFYCTECGHVKEDFCAQVDGFYQLGTARDLEWFAAMVNSGKTDINAVLTADIDFTGSAFAGIGSFEYGYKGTFDGQYHIISNLDLSAVTHDWSGFFNFLHGGATVQNLTLDETCVIYGGKGVGLIGGSTKPGDIHLRNLANHGEVYSTSTNAGGIHGGNASSQAKIYMDNCCSTGLVSGNAESGAISGWLGSNGAVVTNCWSTSVVYGAQSDDKYAFRHDNATLTNVYSMNGTQGKRFLIEDLESGALTYLLNGDQQQITWFQNLDNGQEVDYQPTFMPGHGIVYPVAEMKCDSTFASTDATYSNSNKVVVPDHKFVDGFCSVCGKEDPDYPFLPVFANADHDVTTGYLGEQSADGSGLAINNSVAEHWNQNWFNNYQEITGLQKGVYKLRVQGYSRVRQWDDVIYATGLLGEEYKPLYHNSQYYAEVNGLRMANLFKEITDDRQPASIGFGVENFSEATGCWVPNSLETARAYFAKGLYWNKPIYFVVESETDTVRIGVENRIYLYGNWTVWDTWRLEYVGDLDDAALQQMKNQQVANIQDLSTLSAQTSLVEAYEEAATSIESASTLEEIMEVSDALSRTPQQIRLSHIAYLEYAAAIEEVVAEVNSRDDLNGEYAELLDLYLNDYEEPSDMLVNGTSQYILDEKPLNEEQLKAEIEFVQELLLAAIKTSISEGSDVTHLVYNPNFDEDGNFKGWQTEITRNGGDHNLNSNTGFLDIYPVAGSWNTAFNVWQDLEEGLPNGIYEIEMPALYRTGDNGMGSIDDYVSADIFINDFHTPMMNIYAGEISYADALNGVNCRCNAVDDETAPHNGEQTSSQDTDTGTGYVPEGRYAASFAFNAGRYINHAYAIVTDGKLRIGLRNTGTPWYDKGVAMWGKMTLRYHAQSQEAIDAMMQNFRNRFENIKRARDVQDFYFGVEHLETLDSLLYVATQATDVEEKFRQMTLLNEAFNGIPASYGIYSDLMAFVESLYDLVDTETDEQLIENIYAIADAAMDRLYAKDMTDAQMLALMEEIKSNTTIGGGYYVQGDLVDAEGNELVYGEKHKLYPLTKQEDGTYTGVFKTQNRANRANADSRAGIYITCLGETYKATSANRNFVTPANNEFAFVANGGSDFQMTGGEFKVTLDPMAKTVTFEAIEYNWNDYAFVVGSIHDLNGNQHRWKNDEAAPLAHQGNGVYEGDITFFEDYNYPGFATFTIMTARAVEGLMTYSTTTRQNWTEGRYGSEVNETLIESGQTLTDLVRGLDRKWKLVWDTEDGYQSFHVVFDMNHNTISISKNNGADGIEDVQVAEPKQTGIYTLTGVRVQKPTKGLYIINGKKVLVK